MANENETSTTEEQQTSAETTGQEAQTEVQTTEATPQDNGVQVRINELTKNWRSTERELEAERQRNRDLMAQMVQSVAAMQQRQVQPAEPQVEIDPEDRRKLDLFLRPLMQEVQGLKQRLAVSTVRDEIASIAGGVPAEVAQAASQLLRDWRANGYNGPAEMALDTAYGNFARRQGADMQTAQTQKKQMNASAASVQTGQAAPAQRGSKELSEEDLEQLSYAEQAEYWAKRTGNKAF